MAALIATVLTPADLPWPELQAARLDGELVAMGGGFSPIDEPDAVQLRAHSLASAGPRLIAERATAAWIWGARDPEPAVHEFCVRTGARVHRHGQEGALVREVVITDAEIDQRAGLALTTPLRTAIDLLRWLPQLGQIDAEAVRRLARIGGFSAADCLALVQGRRNLPHRARAVRRILALLGAP